MGLDCNKLTNMKYNSLLSVCLMTALLFSCKTSEVEGIEGTTEVTFSLATDGTHHKVKSELAADYIPEVDDFTVEVFKQEVLRINVCIGTHIRIPRTKPSN